MSAYSTVNITRSKARDVLLHSLVGEVPDNALESFIDTLLEPRLFNCRIVDDNAENEDDLLP